MKHPLAGMTVLVERFGALHRGDPDRPETLIPWCAKCGHIAASLVVERRPQGATRLVIFCHGAQEEVLAPPGTLRAGQKVELRSAFRVDPAWTRPHIPPMVSHYNPREIRVTFNGHAIHGVEAISYSPPSPRREEFIQSPVRTIIIGTCRAQPAGGDGQQALPESTSTP